MTYNLHDLANLISIPLYLEDSSLESVFGDGIYSIVGEGVAANLQEDGTWDGSINNINPDMGYWIMADEWMTFSITGEPVYDLTYYLHEGANLISFS